MMGRTPPWPALVTMLSAEGPGRGTGQATQPPAAGRALPGAQDTAQGRTSGGLPVAYAIPWQQLVSYTTRAWGRFYLKTVIGCFTNKEERKNADLLTVYLQQ